MMRVLDDPKTIQAWRTHYAPRLNLRARHVERRRDLRAAEGIILATVTGIAVWAWAIALWCLIRWALA
jgi:hypothetical protein